MRGTRTFYKVLRRLSLFFSTFYEIFLGIFKEGKVFSGIKEKNRRFEICKKCPYFLKDMEICDECGCFMRIKTGFLNADCPKGYWQKG